MKFKIDKSHLIGLGIVVAAVYVLYTLWQEGNSSTPVSSENQPESLSTQVPSTVSQQPNYPAIGASANPAASIVIGGSPLEITYNTPPASTFAPQVSVAPILTNPGVEGMPQPAGGGGCCDCGDGDNNPNVNWLSQRIAIPMANLQAAAANLASVYASG